MTISHHLQNLKCHLSRKRERPTFKMISYEGSHWPTLLISTSCFKDELIIKTPKNRQIAEIVCPC